MLWSWYSAKEVTEPKELQNQKIDTIRSVVQENPKSPSIENSDPKRTVVLQRECQSVPQIVPQSVSQIVSQSVSQSVSHGQSVSQTVTHMTTGQTSTCTKTPQITAEEHNFICNIRRYNPKYLLPTIEEEDDFVMMNY